MGLDKKDSELLCSLFAVKDIGYVSKPRLVKGILSQHKTIRYLTLELFCSNPEHSYFTNWNEEYLAPLRMERINRLSGGSHNDKKKVYPEKAGTGSRMDDNVSSHGSGIDSCDNLVQRLISRIWGIARRFMVTRI